jgi:transposase
MIPIPGGVQVWLATGHTDMRTGFDGLALLVQETLKRNPHNGHLFVFRGRRGSLLWHDGQGMCLFAKRLERGRFIWPSTIPHGDADRAVTITPVAYSERCERSVLRRTAKASPAIRATKTKHAGFRVDVLSKSAGNLSSCAEPAVGKPMGFGLCVCTVSMGETSWTPNDTLGAVLRRNYPSHPRLRPSPSSG